LVEEKFKRLDSDQIEGGEFEFLGLETRFERNEQEEFTEFDFDFRRNSNFDFEDKI
jgi:hypothetical protein